MSDGKTRICKLLSILPLSIPSSSILLRNKVYVVVLLSTKYITPHSKNKAGIMKMKRNWKKRKRKQSCTRQSLGQQHPCRWATSAALFWFWGLAQAISICKPLHTCTRTLLCTFQQLSARGCCVTLSCASSLKVEFVPALQVRLQCVRPHRNAHVRYLPCAT